jgi:hypothetical protein
VATIGGKFVDAAHYQLPLLAVGLDGVAEELMGDQVRHFMRHRLAQEVLAILTIQLRVEAQLVLIEVGDTRFLSPKPEAHLGAGKSAFEEVFRLLVAGFDAGQ